MFGYVKPFKPEMKICEFEAYKAVYCGLCKRLGKTFGPLARLTLNYDFTFLSLLYISLSGAAPAYGERKRLNPFCRTKPLADCEALAFGADTAVIMLYYKLLDDISDSGFLKAACLKILRPFAGFLRQKAAARRPEADAVIRESVARQGKAEATRTGSLDEASEAAAFAMSELFMLLPCGEAQRRALSRFGYLTGRYVYIADALDDLEDDLLCGGYNPLIERFGLTHSGGDKNRAKEYARESLYMTIGEMTKAYDLLTLTSYRAVLDNIVYLGLYRCVDEIIRKQKKGSLK